MKTIDLYIEDPEHIILDFGGDLDGSCCGNISREIKKELEALGVIITPESVFCRLLPRDMKEAKEKGECIHTEIPQRRMK